jgi:uncharacterized SAM-binding protein YcdF (DUF218 family)
MTVEYQHPAGTDASGTPRERPSVLQRACRVVAVALGLGLILLAAGFVWFAFQVANKEISLNGKADGIVALTGGASRVNDAVELLASGRGRRLLITGVSLTTNTADLSRLSPEHQSWFGCCIDLDYSAVNTIGNAVQTRRWALDHGFRSLVVVTSSYHMPRAMLELGHQLPGVMLIPFPVVTERRRAEPWWSHARSAKILVSEYLKYIVAVARIRLDSEPPVTATAALRGRAEI